MERGIDHLVLAVHDLDAAGRLYEAMGFTVGARNRHPWGTENRIVQFPGTFLELITIGEGASLDPHGPGRFSFGAFVRDRLAEGEGFAMLVLESVDAEADRAAFAAAGIGGFEPFFFERTAVRPDGTPRRVAFSLAFAHDEAAPKAGFFVCQQHAPENFWNPEFQRHANGAIGVSGVVMAAAHPADHAGFLAAFSGVAAGGSPDAGLQVRTPRGSIDVLTRAELADATGLDLRDDPARLVAFRVRVPALASVEDRLGAAGIAHLRHRGDLVVMPDAAHGVAILFQS